MSRDSHDRPTKRRSETSKLSVILHTSVEFEVDVRTGLGLIAVGFLLSAAFLSIAGCGLAPTMSYVGAAVGILANIISRRLLITVAVTAHIEWVPRSAVTGGIDIELTE